MWMRVAVAHVWSQVVALTIAALGTAAPAHAREPATAPAPIVASAPGPLERRPVGSPLSSELAAALPVLESASQNGCVPRPVGLSPRLRIDAACRVQIAVVVRGDADRLAGRIAEGGGLVTRRGGDPLSLQAWAPPALLRALEGDPEVAAIRVPIYARPVQPAGSTLR